MLPTGIEVTTYLYQISPEELKRELDQGQENPNDLIGYASWLFVDLQSKGLEVVKRQKLFPKALLLFRAGIASIEANPALLEHNIDMGLAYFQFAHLLQGFGDLEGARRVLEKAIASGHETPSMRVLLDELPSPPRQATWNADERREFDEFEQHRVKHAKNARKLFVAKRWPEAVEAYRQVMADQEQMIGRWGDKIPDAKEELAGFQADLAVCLIMAIDHFEDRVRLSKADALNEPVTLALKALSLLPDNRSAEEVVRSCAEAAAVFSICSGVVKVDSFPDFSTWKANCEGAYWQLRKHKDFSTAAAYYQEALRCRQDIDFVYHGLGVALVAKGETSNGIRALQRAYELNPEYPFLSIPRIIIESR
ncbi:MAG TPA: hypothetical protein VN285_12290 [Candidatus Deferrimicrobium sp.]|nr:hypothetical protein [Candidatus Deferrimicrobium sp.]